VLSPSGDKDSQICYLPNITPGGSVKGRLADSSARTDFAVLGGVRKTFV